MIGSRCKISGKSRKTKILASNKKLRDSLVKYLKEFRLNVESVASAKDLGVGTIAGVKRTQKLIKGRIVSVRGRVLRIKRLRRVNHQAGKLFNSGAMPQASYGKEGMGINPSTLTQLRALAASAVSTGTHGQCPTTLIWLGLGSEHDPMVKVATDQIRMWLYIADKADPIKVTKAWWAMKARFMTAQVPWGTVREPIGATIATLELMGWNPISPYK